MLTPTPAGAAWPARLAYCAAATFTLASAGTNLNYGISKGADTATSVVWAAVSVAVSIVFALSWPAVIKAVERRQWAMVPMGVAALLLTGAYSVTAALGSASGGRANASATEQLITDQRTKIQAGYTAAQTQLSTLKPSRPVAELEALLAASSSQLRGRGCVVANGTGQLVCPKNAALVAELGRAKRRAELEGKMDKAQAELERIAAPKQANSDAAALAGYLAALGVALSPETMNWLLVLLAVLVIECGGGLALAVGMALGQGHLGRSKETHGTHQVKQGTLGVPSGVPLVQQLPPLPPFPTVPLRFTKTVEAALVRLLREHGAKIVAGQRTLARTLGVSATHINRVLAKLSQAGVVSLDPKSGSWVASSALGGNPFQL
jgi:hypothetical protein